ncbi:MAG: DUF1272 domain-containing protein [Phycisphaerales bacterium]
MLELRPNCECCDRDLPPDSTEARICSFECTFCVSCAAGRLKGICPNCGGELAARPRRPAAKLGTHPPSAARVLKRGGCADVTRGFVVHGLDHVQLAMPAGEEARARAFYAGVLGLTEVPKPANLAKRGGAWFEGGALRVHLGVEAEFRPARKAHPAFLVAGLSAMIEHLDRAGVAVVTDEPLEGYSRVYVADPFGNRIELLEALR